ncbi:fibronectin domain containing protein [Nitzschia inconspicua]|uniref:Fibronectin domain containing protein n=1 Tax=Nitzschia inconspicua TaxID=303405 RepID=A0A9K3L854_9STRA|nr:fibronectin domain containing protein [Nitzschia inconspicua]
MNENTDETLQDIFMQHGCGALILYTLSFLDVVTLLRKQVVSKHFKELCSKTITAKCGEDGPPPLTNETLRTAIREFCPIMYDPSFNKDDMEEIACKYGFPIDSWNVSQVTEMSQLFFWFRHDHSSVENWDPSDIYEMNSVPYFNLYIGSWNTSNVTNMNFMFENAFHFNQDIGKWDVSNVESMNGMFHSALAFNQDIGRWNVSNVKGMDKMFYSAMEFNQDIGQWDVSNVVYMDEMFYSAVAFNQDIGRWDVSNVKCMYNMFRDAKAFQFDLSSWDVSHVLEKYGMLPEGFPEKFHPRNL